MRHVWHAMLTILATMVWRPTRSNRFVSVSKSRWRRVARVNTRRPSSAYNEVVKYCTSLLKPSVIAAPGGGGASSKAATKATQWQRTASTTTLEIVGYSGSPWVTPRKPLNRVLYYPMSWATNVSWSQY